MAKRGQWRSLISKPKKQKKKVEPKKTNKPSPKPKQAKPKKKTDWSAAANKGSKITALGTKQKKTETKIGKKTTLKSVNALTKDESLLMQNASRMPNKKMGNRYLEANRKGLAKKVGSKTAESAYKSKAATGVMQGLSKVDVFSGVGEYDKAAKKAIKKTKKSTAYNVGYGVGMAADMAMGGVGAKGESVAGAIAKAGAKKGAKKAAKKSAKETAKKFARNRAGELVAETPSNVLDAAKMSMDEDGKVNKKNFGKYLAANTAITAGTGGAIEGIGAAATKKAAGKATKLLAKQKAGTITKEESAELGKIVKSLKSKKSGNVSGDIAKKSIDDIQASAKDLRVEKGKAKGKLARERLARVSRETELKKDPAYELFGDASESLQKPKKAFADDTPKASGSKLTEYEHAVLDVAKLKEAKGVNLTANERESYNKILSKTESPLKGRDIKAVSKNRKTNAYQYDNPKVKPHFQETAKVMLKDLQNTVKGEKSFTNSLGGVGEDGSNMWHGTKRMTASDIAVLRDEGMSYAEIEKGLKAIIEDDGAENIAAAKKIEFALDNRLREGYVDVDGYEHLPDNDYIKMLNEETPEAKPDIDAEIKTAQGQYEAAGKAVAKAKAIAKNSIAKNGELTPERAAQLKVAEDAERAARERLRKAQSQKKYAALENERMFTDEPAPKEKPVISKENAYEDYKAQKSKPETPAAKTQKEAVVKERGKLRKWFDEKYNNIVSTLAPFERIANQAATSEGQNFARSKINKMLLAKGKARTMIQEQGEKIFTSRGLEKDAAKMEAYDSYAILTHDLDRLKQKYIKYFVDGEQKTMDISKFADKNGNVDIGKVEETLAKKHDDYKWDGTVNDKGGSGLNEEQIKDVLADLEKKYGKDIKEYQKELVNYHDELLKMDYEAGIVSKKQYLELKSKYPNYVPTFRENELDEFVNMVPQAEINVAKLYNIKGASDAPIMPMYTQMVAKTNKVMKRTAENDMLNAVAEVNGMKLEDLPGGHTPEELIEVSTGVYKTDGGATRVFFYQDGKGVSMPISKDAYDALRKWSGADRSAVMKYKLIDNKATQTMARGFKAWITDYSLIFGARNFMRDTRTALLYSQHPAKWFSAFPKAIMSIMPESALKTLPETAQKECQQYKKLFNAYRANGGKYSSLVTSTDLNKAAKLSGKKEGIPVLRIAKEFNDALETIPRMQEFIATMETEAKKFGGDIDRAITNKDSIDLAMYNAKEVTLNFDRSGELGALLNRGVVPFFNPSIQGLDKLIRFMTTDNKSMRDFVNMGVKMATMVAMPIAVWEVFVGDNEDYHKLSAYNKYNYLCIPIGKDENGDPQFIKIPRAREIGAAQAPIEWLFENMKYESRDGTANLFESFKQLGGTMVSQIGPVNPLTDNLFSPFINLARNRTWFGNNIESFDDAERRKAGKVNQIYDTDTSSAAVSIMTFINNAENKALKTLGVSKDAQMWLKRHQVSPKQLDNVFDSYLGVIYDMGLSAFSQKGTSVNELNGNPASVLKKLSVDPYVSAFVVNGTLSSARKTEMYSQLSNLQTKLENEPEGSEKYNEIQGKITKLKNNCVYDVQTYDTAIDFINRNKKLTSKQKEALVMQMKREQNSIMDNYAKTGKAGADPLKTLYNMKDKNGKRLFTTEEVINNFTYTDNEGRNSVKSGWQSIKETDAYKKTPKLVEKKFLNITFSTREVAAKCGESKSYLDFQSMAVVCADRSKKKGGNYSDILAAYHVSNAKQKMADVYINQMGGSAATYIASHKRLVAGAEKLGLYTSQLKDHDYAMILANAKTVNGNKLKDRAYFIEDANSWGSGSYAYMRMNPARCLSSNKYKDSKWTYEKVHKFADKHDLDYSSSDDKIVNAINEKYPGKTREEKAALFAVIKPTDNNPFGEIEDYSVDGDTGYSSGRRGGWRRRRRGGGGGSSRGPAFNPDTLNMSKWNIKGKKVSNVTFKSNLNDAYRKKANKLRKQSFK